MKKMITRFFFKSSSVPLDVILPVSEAERVFNQWSEKRSGLFKGYIRDENFHWAIIGEEVACICLLDFDYQQRLQQQQSMMRSQGGMGQLPSLPPPGPIWQNPSQS